MKLPNPDEYHSAIQNPKIAFSDPELKTCAVERDPLGLPIANSGGFAVIYHLCDTREQGPEWAVRCFCRDIPDLRKRYEAISRFLEKHAGTIFVDARLLSKGILVRGQWYPTIKMPWVRGDPLGIYIEKNLSNHAGLSWLPSAFLELVKNLEMMQIAHGDLQHGNIMVTGHTLRLIDYDGMCLSELAGLGTNQLGHINYQHPLRDEHHFNLKIDRFSEMVIYTALQAVVANPKLWRKYSVSENLLFRRNDFLDPDSSELLADLKKLPKLEPLVTNIRSSCYLRFDEIPSLEDFVSGRVPTPRVIPIRPKPEPISRELFRVPSSQYEVIEAEDIATLLNRVGHMVQVVGRITACHRSYTKDKNLPYVFMNFGDWRKKCFTLVIWSAGLELFLSAGLRVTEYKSKWVNVTGVISEYQGRPQIQITVPSQIEPLPIAEDVKLRVRKSVQLPNVCSICGSPTNTFNLKGGRATYVCPKCAKSQTSGGPTTPAREQSWYETPATPLSSHATTRPSKPISAHRSNEAAVLQQLYGTYQSTSPAMSSTTPRTRSRPKIRPISIPSVPRIPFVPSGKISRIAFSLVLVSVSILSVFYASQLLVIPTPIRYSTTETSSLVRTSTIPVNAYSIRTITSITTSTTSYRRGDEDTTSESVITTLIATTQTYQTHSVLTEIVLITHTAQIETTLRKIFAETYPAESVALSVGIGTLLVLFLARTHFVPSFGQAALNRRLIAWKRWLLRLWSSLDKIVH